MNSNYLQHIPRELLDPFNRLFNDQFWGQGKTSKVSKVQDGSVVTINVPGVIPDNIKVNLKGKMLSIVIEDESYSYRISDDYDLDSIEAKLDLGVLKIFIKKNADTQAKEIPLQLGPSSKTLLTSEVSD